MISINSAIMKTTTVLLIVFISQAASAPISGEERQIVPGIIDGISNGIEFGGAVVNEVADFWYDVWFGKNGQPEDLDKFLAEAEGRGIFDAIVGGTSEAIRLGGDIVNTGAGLVYDFWFGKDGQPEDVEKFFAEGRKLIFSNKKNVAELFNGYGGTGLGLISRKSGKAILAQDLVHYMCTQMECRPLELTGRAAEDSSVYKYQMLNKKTGEVVAEFESETKLKF